MSISVDVHFFRNGFETGYIAHSRPVRQLASGLAGIVHGGRVYPLYRGNIAKFEDITCSPSACNGFFLDASEIRYHEEGSALIERWVHQDTWRGNYLSFDADDHVAALLLAEIEAKIGPARLGMSFRPASDASYYDWFIKLPTKAIKADLEKILAELPTGRVAYAEAPATEAATTANGSVTSEGSDAYDPEPLRAETNEQKNLEIAALEASIKSIAAAKDSEISQLRNEVVLVTRVAESAKKKQLAMRSELVRLRQTQQASIMRHVAESRPGSTEQEVPSEFKEWEDLLIESWTNVESLNAEKKEHLQAISTLEVELEMARSEIKNLKLQAANPGGAVDSMAQRRIFTAGGAARRLQKHFVTALRVLLPRLRLSDADYEVLMNDFLDVEDVLHCLQRLDEGDVGPVKKFHGVRGVYEYHKHLGTGESARGRVYWRSSPQGINVAIEVKEDETGQERFVRGRFE